MDERLNKLLWLIERLPADQIVIIAEKCKGFGEISPKVQKLISIFDKLSDEEKEQFFRNVTPPCHGDTSWDPSCESEADMTTESWSDNEKPAE